MAVAANERTANRGELLVGLHAKQSPDVPAVQLLKSDSEYAFQWEVHWPKNLPYMLFYGNVTLSPDGDIRRFLGGAGNGSQASILRPGVVFYREDRYFLASGSTFRPRDLGGRILSGYQGVFKHVCGEDSVYLHHDQSRPIVLLQVQREEEVGTDNAEAYLVAIMSEDVYLRLSTDDSAEVNPL